MKFVKNLIFSSLTLFTASLHAQEWVKVAESDKHSFHIQAGSFRTTENDSGVKVFVVNGKFQEHTTKKINAVQWYVPIRHCMLGRGKLVSTDTIGKYQQEHDFIFGTGNVGSIIAEVICGIEQNIEQQKKPNLKI